MWTLLIEKWYRWTHLQSRDGDMWFLKCSLLTTCFWDSRESADPTWRSPGPIILLPSPTQLPRGLLYSVTTEIYCLKTSGSEMLGSHRHDIELRGLITSKTVHLCLLAPEPLPALLKSSSSQVARRSKWAMSPNLLSQPLAFNEELTAVLVAMATVQVSIQMRREREWSMTLEMIITNWSKSDRDHMASLICGI